MGKSGPPTVKPSNSGKVAKGGANPYYPLMGQAKRRKLFTKNFYVSRIERCLKRKRTALV